MLFRLWLWELYGSGQADSAIASSPVIAIWRFSMRGQSRCKTDTARARAGDNALGHRRDADCGPSQRGAVAADLLEAENVGYTLF